MRRLLVPLVLLLSIPAFAEERPATDPWAGLRFLVGEWVGVGSGKPGEGTGGFTFAPDLDGKILLRKNFSEFPPKPGEKHGMRHEDLLIVYPAGGALKAEYFDNEGHVIAYTVTTAPGQATFESDAKPGAPRFKLVYAEQGQTLSISFLI